MRTSVEDTFSAGDGQALFYRYYPAQCPRARGAILLLHRGHEHSGRMAHLVDELDLPEFAFLAWDARGHGRSPGERGDSPSVALSVEDIQAFVDHVSRRYGFAVEDIAVVGQSVAGALLAAWAHDYAPAIRAMVLAAPAFHVKLYVPFAWPALRVARAVRGNFFVKSYVKARFLTHDPVRRASYDTDPLIARAISVNVLLGLHDLSTRVVADAEAITVPTQLLIAANDYVIDSRPQHEFYERLGALTKERHVLKGFYHDLLGEQDRVLAIGQVRRFLMERFDSAVERPSLQSADRTGFTRREADALARPFSALSPRSLYWRLVRQALRLGGFLSDGIRLGIATGFDSGRSLDYVYRNVPAGRGLMGQWIDRVYLDALGWQGIRQRKRHLELLIREAIDRLDRDRVPARIVDVAAGVGRCVLDALADGPLPAEIELRDYSDDNVAAGRALIRARGLDQIATFTRGNAFSQETPVSKDRGFTMGVVSGLYELYADNGAVRRSLERFAAMIEEGGYLIYTGQPWHPQLEFIARALTSHREGQAWVMRRRTQPELDELVATTGFTKIAQRIDEWGMFTVSLARRSGRAAGHGEETESAPLQLEARG